MIRRMYQAPLLALFAALFLVACASEKVSQQEYSEPLQMMAKAEQAGANGNSDAAIHMQYAQENLRKADALIDEEDFDDARYYLDMAKADAKLALIVAEESQMRLEVEELESKITDVNNDTL